MKLYFIQGGSNAKTWGEVLDFISYNVGATIVINPAIRAKGVEFVWCKSFGNFAQKTNCRKALCEQYMPCNGVCGKCRHATPPLTADTSREIRIEKGVVVRNTIKS